MTLDETIKEAKITAVVYEKEAHKFTLHGGSFYEEKAKVFRESAKDFTQIAEWLEELKAYRVADRPQGEWIAKDGVFYCSCCGNDSAGLSEDDVYVYEVPLPNYCQDCGARMKGADDE